MQQLRKALGAINRKPYKAYKSIKGRYTFKRFDCRIDHVQGDPFATPSRISVIVPMHEANFPQNLWQNPVRKIALEDFLARGFQAAIKRFVKGNRGIGKSGLVTIDVNGQQVLARNCVVLDADAVEVRFNMGLPAAGRTILAQEAMAMFFDELPQVVEASLFYENCDQKAINKHVDSVEDQSFLRDQLQQNNAVAFIANGACLARQSGIDDRPLTKGQIRFQTPQSLQHSLLLPNAGEVSGMLIPRGVTLIVGGGFHGKSTLLHAIERGVYNHIPGDGREQLVTDASAVKVRAEDGRVVSRVNISGFIDHLPFGRDTQYFQTENASGSTSQAATIMEALEVGTRLLLIDEDTSATNFMIRDARMQALVADEKEPITPYLQRVRELYEKHNVSSIIVMGGSGDYFAVSDTVIMMDAYVPHDVTQKAQQLAVNDSLIQAKKSIPVQQQRRPKFSLLNPSRGKHAVKIDVRATQEIRYGEHAIDLSKVEQLVDPGQLRAIAWMMAYYANELLSRDLNFAEAVDELYALIEEKGLDFVTPYLLGNLAMPRKYELAATINRIREGDWQ